MNNTKRIYVRFIGKEDDPQFTKNECYLLDIRGMIVSGGRKHKRIYDSIESFLKEWSFICDDFMGDMNN